MDGVAQAKGELFDHLKPGGTAVLNADDRYFETLKKKFSGRVLSFGIDNKSDVRASGHPAGMRLHGFHDRPDGSTAQVRLRAVGKHNIYNALAAAGAALALGHVHRCREIRP